MRYFDNTRVSTYKECPRKFYLRHVRHWRSAGTAPALVFGLSWHEGMDKIWGHANVSTISDRELRDIAMEAFLACWTENGFPSWDEWGIEHDQKFKIRTPGTAAEMFENYIDQRRKFIAENEVIAIEKPFVVPLSVDKPEIGYVGRLDKVFRAWGRIHIGEHKTTSAYKKGGPFRADWMDSWSPNSQIDGYLHAGHMLYGDEMKSVMIDGALVHKTIHDGFKFLPIDRMITQLDAWLWETNYWISLIIGELEKYEDMPNASRDTDVLRMFPKQTGSCNNFAGCTYRNLCKSMANPEQHECPEGFIVEKWEPFNILELGKLGLEDEE